MRDVFKSVMNAIKGTGSPSKEIVKVPGDEKRDFITLDDSLNISNYDQQIISVKVSKHGEYVACVYCDGTVMVYDSFDGTPIFVYEDEETKNYFKEHNEWRDWESSLDFSHDSKLLAYGRGIGEIKVFNIEQQKIILEHKMFDGIDEPEGYIGSYFAQYTYVAFSKSDRFVVALPTARFDPQDADGRETDINPVYFRTFNLLDLDNGHTVLQYTFEKWKIGSVAFSFDDKYFSCAQFGGDIIVWDISQREIVFRKEDFFWLPDSRAIKMSYNILFDEHQNLFYTSKEGIKKISLNSPNTVMFTEDYRDDFCYAFKLYDGEKKMVAALRKGITVWDTTTGKQIASIKGCNSEPHKIFSDDDTNRMIVTFGWSKIRIWDAQKLTVEVDLNVPDDWDITDVSENCRVIAAGHRCKLYVKRLE